MTSRAASNLLLLGRKRIFSKNSYVNPGHWRYTYDGKGSAGKKSKIPEKAVLALSVTGVIQYFRNDKEQFDMFEEVRKSQSYIENGNIKGAEGILLKTLQEAQHNNNEDVAIQVRELLADIALKREDFKKAEQIVKETLQEMSRKGFTVDNPKIVYMKLKLASIFEQAQNYKEAEKEYNQCISVTEPKVHQALQNKEEEILALWLNILQQYSDYLHKMDNHHGALDSLHKAYNICTHLYGEASESIIAVLSGLAKAHYHIGDLDSASQFLSKAADLGKVYPDAKELSTVHTYLGSTYFKKGLLEEAKKFCDMALDSAIRHTYSPNIAEASTCLMNVINAME